MPLPKSAIHAWITDCSADSTTSRTSKRRRLNPRPLTPDPSVNSHDNSHAIDCGMSASRRTTSPSKRSEPEPGPGGAETTPQSKRFRADIEFAPSEVSLASASGRQSPSKQIRTLRHQSDGIEYRELSDFTNKPPSLLQILDSIDSVMEGQGILPAAHKDALSQAAKEYQTEFRWAAKENTYHFSTTREHLGVVPSVQEVLDILDKAAECSQGEHPEDNWNKFVHAPLLEFGLRQSGQRTKNQFISATSW